jgi:hypothetical protein
MFACASRLLGAAALGLWMALASVAPAAADPAGEDRASLEAQKELLFKQMLASPSNLDVIFAYANVSAKLGDNEASLSALERMLLFNPNLPRVDLELGVLYFRMGSFETAQSYFKKALAADPPPEVKARVDQYLGQIATAQARSQLTGYVFVGAQYQSDANVAPGSPLINSPIGPLLLSSQFVKERDENFFVSGSTLYSYDLGTPNRDTFEVTGTGFAQHYFRVQRLDLDFGEVTAGPRFRFPDLDIPWAQSASIKPYAIVNEVGLGQNQYFYTYGNGIEGTATLWNDIAAKMNFEFRHKTFTNQPDRPQSTGLDGDDKLVSLSVTKPITDNSALSLDLAFLDQDTSFNYYSNKTYSAGTSYRVRYDDPTGWIGLPWETTISGSRVWSLYGAPDPCCSTSGDPAVFSPSSRDDRHWRFGLSQVFQVSEDTGVVLQLQRDIVSSNLPLYAYTSNTVLIGLQRHFSVAPGATADDSAGDSASNAPTPDLTGDSSTGGDYRIEGGIGGAFGSNSGSATVRTGGTTVTVNNQTLTGNGLAGSVALWSDGPLAKWTGNPVFDNFSFGIEYRHYDTSESSGVTASVPGFGVTAGTVTGNFESENLMLDAAWRLNSGKIHPYIGVGGGAAFFNWSGKLTAPALSASSLSAGITSSAIAGHTFIGLDYDITPKIYVGAGADFYLTDTVNKQFTHTDIRMNSNQLSLLAHAGFRF